MQANFHQGLIAGLTVNLGFFFNFFLLTGIIRNDLWIVAAVLLTAVAVTYGLMMKTNLPLLSFLILVTTGAVLGFIVRVG